MSLLSLISVGLKSLVNTSVPVWLVIGNEACDLDSAVSSIVYSLLLSAEGKPSTSILNVNKSDYAVKTEVSYWLNKHNLKMDNLLFRDEIVFIKNVPHLLEQAPVGEQIYSPTLDEPIPDTELSSFKALFNSYSGKEDILNVCLVDHHILASADSAFEPYIKEIIDHRPLEKSDFGRVSVTQSLVGSCCTLVTEQVLMRKPELLPDVAELLHGCIVLDTVNCLPEAGRATPRDVSALDCLEQAMEGAVPSRCAILQELVAAKSDISSLSSLQLLRRDTKIAPPISVCSLSLPVTEFLSRPDALASLDTHTASGPYSATMVLGLHLSDTAPPARDLAVYALDKSVLKTLCNSLITNQDGLLQLEQSPESSLPPPLSNQLRDSSAGLFYFLQHNAKASRKQIMPIVKEFLAKNPCSESRCLSNAENIQ